MLGTRTMDADQIAIAQRVLSGHARALASPTYPREDLVQDALVRLWTLCDQWDRRESSWASWCYSRGKWAMIDVLRDQNSFHVSRNLFQRQRQARAGATASWTPRVQRQYDRRVLQVLALQGDAKAQSVLPEYLQGNRMARQDHNGILVRELLASLTPEERTLMEAFYYRECSAADIGRARHQATGSIRNQLRVIRKKLEEIVKETPCQH